MSWWTSNRSILRIATLALVLLVPTVARAGWGDENWGEMIWGGGAPAVPFLPFWGRIVLVILMAALPGRLLLRRHRKARL